MKKVARLTATNLDMTALQPAPTQKKCGLTTPILSITVWYACLSKEEFPPPPLLPFLRRMKLLTSHRCTLSLPSLYTLAASLVRTHLVLQSLTLSTTALRSCSMDGQSSRRVLQITVTTIHSSLPVQQKTRRRKHPIPHMPRSTDSHITNW